MITHLTDRERALSAQIDEQGGQLEAWRDRAIAAEAELARLRAQKPAAWVRQYHHSGVLCWENEGGNCAPLYRAAPPAQPAEPTIDEQVASVNAVFDAWRNGEDATLTLGLAAQPAEPVQRLSDERAAFEAWHKEYRTQELVRRDDTYYNTHVRCRWEGRQARAIESALQPGWRPEWPAFVEYWTHESHLQTFADRERFRAAAKAMLEAAPKATK